ncbi:olfactory receptor 5T7-like [Dipodomys merriami]|uniref:olfactory receptor 5T7-like n=1 Tax=Dipodomys merriami TaxID=94247 RepID=UPI0038557940
MDGITSKSSTGAHEVMAQITKNEHLQQEPPLGSAVEYLPIMNVTEVTLFVLKGFTDSRELQIVFLFLFLAIYLFTLLGNLGLIVLVLGDSRLHNPMYYFLGVLSSVDACYSSVITPNMLVDFMSKEKVISVSGCATQMFLAVMFGTTECFLLAAMAYDRYIAIYNPLLYTVNMSPRVYVPLIIASYIGGFAHGIVHTVATFRLSFCGSNKIRHIFCDIPALLAISCSDTHINQLLLFYCAGSIELVTIVIVLVSYGFILAAILKMRSAEGKRKVFSTCGSHLTAVSVFHGTVLFMYVRPSSNYALEHDMVVSIFYAIMIPMLNPLIYSLRNKDVKQAMQKLFRKYFLALK